MSDLLANGQCRCGCQVFKQITLVVLASSTFTVKPADGRYIKLSQDVRKSYECFKCGQHYFYNEDSDSWVNP